ncbi:MAG: transcription antitermination factor NusB [Clostridia bacterium]|nr:transcription antitermination factor NusB [Clostridia bacterium]
MDSKNKRPQKNYKPKYTEEERKAFVEQRRKSREQCFALIFEMSFTDDNYMDVLDSAIESRLIETDEFIDTLMDYYSNHKNEIDERIRPHIKGWAFNRVSKVSLSAIRLAVCEVACKKSSVGAAVNEAVELVKKYGAEKEHSFVNAVLSSMYREKK